MIPKSGVLRPRALRYSHVRKATPGYARQSCTGMLPGTLGYGPTTPHHRRETFEKHGFLRSFFFAYSILLHFYSILLVELNSTGFQLNSTGFLLNSTRFLLNSNQFY